jgi:type IV pilus assembly protein PilY1
VEGVIQDVSTKVRLGLAFYRTNTSSNTEGGFIQVAVNGTSLSSVINQINGHSPDSNTPLAETLWTVTGYFEQLAIDPAFPAGPGPRYQSGDYQLNNTNDPYNYGTGGATRYPSCSKSFVLFITDGEPCADGNLPTGLQDYASGISTFNCSGGSCLAVASIVSGETFSFPATTFPSCGAGDYVAGMEDVALYMHTHDLRSGMTGTQTLTLYPVFAFGRGSTLLKFAAINGAFEDSNGNGIPDLQSEWDKNGDGQPDTYFEATDGAELEQAIKAAFSNMITRVASGTAASVLASGEGSGANLIQASFYPRRRFGNDVVSWVGGLQNLWYFLDPFGSRSNMREDTDQNDILHLQNDYIMQFYFDTGSQTTKAARSEDQNGDGTVLNAKPTVAFENVKNIWEAAQTLWSRDISVDPRTLYTTITGTSFLSGGFSTGNAGTLASYMTVTDRNGSGSTTDEAQNVIRYLHGEEIVMDLDGDGINDFRPRLVTQGTGSNVWKLGDILNSTPKIASWVPLNPYWTFYKDSTYNDFTKTTSYLNRGAVFVGSNDGMFHAFRLGKLELSWSGKGAMEKAKVSGTDLGRELWAYIPKNVLPYLKYIPDQDYCHLYTVDLSPVIVDVSINKPSGCGISTNYWDCDKDVTSWRTVVIGGMRFGGACRNITTTCTDVDGDGQKDCVNTPTGGNGYSSYFALDVTDQSNPQLLWEFSSAELGFATTGPSIVRISAKDPITGDPVPTKNGKWFVVIGSGPTGPIDTVNHQFMGRSDQNMKLFVLDLKTGSLLRTVDTGIQYTFAGSMYNATHDANWPLRNGNYQDDVVYIPYTKRTAASPYTWTSGGIGNLLTKENLNPANWVWRTIIDGIGPVTSSVQNLDAKESDTIGNLWLYFGTGRYYYAQGVTAMDDYTGQRQLLGIKHPCAYFVSTASPPYMQIDPACTTTVNYSSLTNVTSITNVPSSGTANGASFKGWYINLDPSGSYTYTPDPPRNFGAERVITDPVVTTRGLVFFTAFKPYSDECALGGKTFIWAALYNTGGAGGNLLQGKVLVQVSTGSIAQVDLSTAMTDAGGRKSNSAIEGEPPVGQGMSLIGLPSGPKRVLLFKER